MAKWGEGDPRWIVEERADATNVNNWHWTEKNASGWSKETLKSLFEGFIIEDDSYFCEIKELTSIEGEASANNRKAKLIFFYEWVLKADWKGKLKSSDTSYKGTFEIPNLSDENDASDVDVDVSVKIDDDEARRVKDFMRVFGQKKIREQIEKYIQQLREEFSQGMILPSGVNKSASQNDLPKVENEVKQKLSQPILNAVKNMKIGVKINCKNLKDKCEFKCRASELYRALTDPGMVRAFSQSEAQVDASKGGQFSMFNNNISGEFLDLEIDKMINMRWRFKSWPAEHYSNVKLTFEEKEDCTVLVINQTGIPESDYERTKEGWQRYYWQSIKQTFGFGSNLF